MHFTTSVFFKLGITPTLSLSCEFHLVPLSWHSYLPICMSSHAYHPNCTCKAMHFTPLVFFKLCVSPSLYSSNCAFQPTYTCWTVRFTLSEFCKTFYFTPSALVKLCTSPHLCSSRCAVHPICVCLTFQAVSNFSSRVKLFKPCLSAQHLWLVPLFWCHCICCTSIVHKFIGVIVLTVSEWCCCLYVDFPSKKCVSITGVQVRVLVGPWL